MDAFLQSLCIFCAAVTGPQPQVSQIVGFFGHIRYTHERVGQNLHLLRLSTTDFIIDREKWRQERLLAFAERYANDTCSGHYRLGPADNPSWPRITTTTVGKQFVFRCI